MADRGETARNINTLHLVFAVSSLAMLGSLAWMLYADYDREWKGWQKKFRQVEVDRTNVAIQRVNNPQPGAKTLEQQVADMEKDIQDAASKTEREDKEYAQLRSELDRLNGDLFANEQLKKFAKAEEDAVRYDIEMKRLQTKDATLGEAKLRAAGEKTRLAALRYEAALRAAKEAEDRIAKKLQAVNEKKGKLAAARRELDRLRTRRDDLTSLVKQSVMNAPGLDFIQPTLLIKKQVLNGLFFELNFTKKTRIDMCQSCHMAIDVPGYDTHEIPRVEGENFAARLAGWVPVGDVVSNGKKLAEKGKAISEAQAKEISGVRDIQSVVVDLPEPLKSHPRLDLYLSASSPHPIESFGCTVCHRGSGESVGFVTSDHSPELFHREIMASALTEAEKFKKNEEAVEHRKEEWHDEYHWHKQHHWDYPMLPVSYTEASCLQCHKDSLETIRDAAPTLYKGYKLVEERGCYACHKIQGFRETRKPGPTLQSIAEKVTPEFAYAWISNPTDFRPTTKMPRFFHLENTVKVDPPKAPTEESVRAEVAAKLGTKDKAVLDREAAKALVEAKQSFEAKNAKHLEVKAAYDKMGRDYRTTVWDDVAVHGIVTYLFANSKPFAIGAPPVKGDAEKGKDQFQLAGCLACHALGEGAEQIGKPNPYANYGPNLAGVGSKLSEAWLFQWLKEPHAWWADTRMPNLRLADDEAANIAAFLMTQKKADWAPAVPPVDPAILDREAMTFLTSKFSRVESERYLGLLREGKFDELVSLGVMDKKVAPQKPLQGEEAVSYYLGERWIGRQGCYSCHLVHGLEEAQAIGTELTEWGTKEVEKLDFGLLEHTWEVEKAFGPNNHPYMNLKGTPSEGREFADGLNHESRIQWLEQKLRAPRSYDRGRDKLPLDIWRMPYFGFSEEEIQAITTYVIGLVKEGDVAEPRKMRLEGRKRALEEGWHEIRTSNCVGCHPFDMESIEFEAEGKRVAAKGLVTVDEEGDDTISMQLWEPSPDLSLDTPEDNKVSAITTVERKQIVARRGMHGGGIWPSLVARYQAKENKGITEALPFLPPVLAQEGDKIQPQWLFGFLKQPYTLRPIVKVHMPNFSLSDERAQRLSVFFPEQQRRTYARRLSLDLRREHKLTREALAADAKLGGAEKVASIETGVAPNDEAMGKLLAFAKAKGVSTPAPPEMLERLKEREESYRAARESEHQGYFDKASTIAAEATAGNCYSCHYRGALKPSGQEDSWAPDLSRVRERLRPDWVLRWVSDPQSISPGTKMPAPAEYPKIFDAPRVVQMTSLKDLLFNWDYFQSLVMGAPKVALQDDGAKKNAAPAGSSGK